MAKTRNPATDPEYRKFLDAINEESGGAFYRWLASAAGPRCGVDHDPEPVPERQEPDSDPDS